jgi:methyltransferase-like protein
MPLNRAKSIITRDVAVDTINEVLDCFDQVLSEHYCNAMRLDQVTNCAKKIAVVNFRFNAYLNDIAAVLQRNHVRVLHIHFVELA